MRNLSLYILLAILLSACGDKKKAADETQLPVVSVSILPQKYFVEQITGNSVNVQVLVAPGASPATYDPTPKQLQQLSNAKVHFYIGELGFEKAWLSKLKQTAPAVPFVACNEWIEEMEGACDHSNDEPCDHEHHEGHHHNDAEKETTVEESESHEGHNHDVDPHIWMSPKNGIKIAQTIHKKLVEIFPESKDIFDDNLSKLIAEIEKLDVEIAESLSNVHHRDFMIYHPALGYFSRDYGLNQHSIEFEGKTPSPAHMRKMVDLAASHHIQGIFIQSQFESDKARAIAKEINAEIIEIDPLSENWMNEMRTLSTKMKKILTH